MKCPGNIEQLVLDFRGRKVFSRIAAVEGFGDGEASSTAILETDGEAPGTTAFSKRGSRSAAAASVKRLGLTDAEF